MSNEEQIAYDKGQNDKCQYMGTCCLYEDNQVLRIERERLTSEVSKLQEEKQYLEAEISKRDECIDNLEADNKDAAGELELWQRENAVLKQILDNVMKISDVCSLCAMKGQSLPDCKCSTNVECIKNLIKLWG